MNPYKPTAIGLVVAIGVACGASDSTPTRSASADDGGSPGDCT